MTISHVAYDLNDGFINNWLVAGPQVIPVHLGNRAPNLEKKASIAREQFEKNYPITHVPVEPGPLKDSQFVVGSYQGEWSYYRCREDHTVDVSGIYSANSFLRAWAYTQLVSPSAQNVVFTLTVSGPVDVWINKKVVFHSETFAERMTRVTFNVGLVKGTNTILVRMASVATPQAQMAFALQVQGEGLTVRIPTLIPSLSRRTELEGVNELIYIERDVYAADQKIRLHWPGGLAKQTYQDVRLINAEGFIYGQGEDVGKPASAITLGVSAGLKEGPYRAFVMPRAWEYYESQIRVSTERKFWVMGRNTFSQAPYGTLEERRQEALLDAAARENDLFAEIAKMGLGAWVNLEMKVLKQALEAVQQRQAGSAVYMLAFAGLMTRFGQQPDFPTELVEPVQAALLGYHYPEDAAGDDALSFEAEDQQIIGYAGQILAGQLYPQQVFANSGLTGTQQRERGEAQALAWMQEHAAHGFAAWDSKQRYANILTALSYLVDLSAAEPVWELGSVLMDKLFFSLALNAYQGVYGSSQGDASLESIQSGLLEATSGITRLMWGLGIFNYHTAGTVSLALLQNYEIPSPFADIAASQPAEMLGREQQASGGQTVNKVMYRTPHFMLSSAQDYRPGQPGQREHIWQATLGPQSVVFVNQPGNSYENDAHTPNLWVGNGSLPRVAQWQETLIAIYQIADDALLGYTHAYFPTADFDEYVLRENAAGVTAFARKGDGYLALTAAQGMELIQTGRTAMRELRSYGRQNIWVCQMGQASNGSFAEFQERVLAQPVGFEDLAAEVKTARGETLSFGWQDPLRVNGVEQALSGFKHYENPYTTTDLPCSQMEIIVADNLLRLKFSDLQ